MWLDANSSSDRSKVEKSHGTRYSELRRLPYFRPSLQVLVDPMHTMFLVLLKRYFRDSLRLDNPDAKDKPKRLPSRVSHFHEFTLPPPLSRLGVAQSDEEDDEDEDLDPLAMLTWTHLSEDMQRRRNQRASKERESITESPTRGQDVTPIHLRLASPRPESESLEAQLVRRLKSFRWHDLAYVCNDLMVFPTRDGEEPIIMKETLSPSDMTKEEMAEALMRWVRGDTLVLRLDADSFFSALTRF